MSPSAGGRIDGPQSHGDRDNDSRWSCQRGSPRSDRLDVAGGLSIGGVRRTQREIQRLMSSRTIIGESEDRQAMLDTIGA